MNKVILIGNLANEPQTAATASGKNVCRFTVATDRRSKEKVTDFHSIVAFGKTADICGQYLKKGNKVAVIGELQYSTYEKDGIKRTSTAVIVNSVEFLTKMEKQEQLSAEDLNDYKGDLPF